MAKRWPRTNLAPFGAIWLNKSRKSAVSENGQFPVEDRPRNGKKSALIWAKLGWLGLGWFGLVWAGLARLLGMVWAGLAWFGLVWPSATWVGLVGAGLAWFGPWVCVVWFGSKFQKMSGDKEWTVSR